MTPEEEEIQKREIALQEAEQALAQVETEYAEHRLQLKAFEQAYILAVQAEQAEIHRWEGLIVQQINRIHHLNSVQDGIIACPVSPYDLGDMRVGASRMPEEEEVFEPISVNAESNPDIKSLYRELARRYHPDLAENAAVRDQRAAVMQEINTAYQQRDLDKLIQISHRPEILDPERESAGDRLVWLIRRQAEVAQGVQAAQEKYRNSQASPLGQLMAYCAERPEEKRFAEVKRRLKQQIRSLKSEWGLYCQQESQIWQELL